MAELRSDEGQFVGKFLKALSEGEFDPRSKRFNVSWTPQNAAVVELAKIVELLHWAAKRKRLSEECARSFFRFFTKELMKHESWNMFNLALLQVFDPGLKSLKHELGTLIVATSLAFTMPAADVILAPLLAARNWRTDVVPCLTTPLWKRVMAYVLEFPTVLDQARSPLILADLRRFQVTVGIIPITAQHLQRATDRFVSRMLTNSLAVNDCRFDRDWMNASAGELQGCVARALGHRHQPLLDQGQHESRITSIGLAVQLICVSLRLRSKVPVLLVGDFGGSADVEFVEIAAALLPPESGTARPLLATLSAPDSSADMIDRCMSTEADRARLLLLRCQSQQAAQLSLLEYCLETKVQKEFGMAVCSLDAADYTALLPNKLPAILRFAAVFV